MASVLLYLALSACATAAVGAYAAPQAWEAWSEHEHERECHGGSRAEVHAPAVVVRADRSGHCHSHDCHRDASGARVCDD